MAKRGRPPKLGGAVYKRNNSDIWQVRYKDQKGEMIRESAGTTDRQQAERFLRDRLDARDEGRLSVCLPASNSHSTNGPIGFWRSVRSRRFGARAITSRTSML